ncbi:single-stranded DNA-binding protein [Sporosarcina sp. FSL K6-3457]|uniref:single-stranded DNA-binding protein n=1 Tax=Sporosarcina sp. FSL K6-3457 TaxID=2978204 RepID=UPI0030F933DB
MNQVALVGRITKDPILRRVSEGRVQTSFVLAVNRNFKNQNGEVDTDFVLCTMWGRGAENTAKHCGKGSLIGVGGRIQSRSYEREDKSRVYVTEVIGEDIRFIATKRRSNDNLYGEAVRSNATAPSVAETKEEEHFDLPNRETEGLPIF